MNTNVNYQPGGDSKVISKIANEFYGGFESMFTEHEWPERGKDMMRKVQTRVAESYGSIKHFEDVHNGNDPFSNNPSVLLTSFWGYHPPSWGCVGFTQEGRRNTIVRETTDPFIVAIYVTDGPHEHTPKYMWGRVVGFYEVTHIEGDKKEFIEDWQYEREAPEKWRYSLKATRAWQIIPEYMPEIRTFDPSIHDGNRMQTVAKNGEYLSAALIDKLKALPRQEFDVFRIAKSVKIGIEIPIQTEKQYVQGGSGRACGYEVGEPKDTEKELYILHLSGDENAYLGFNSEGRKIVKIGLSVSPQIRCDFFQKTMPLGAFKWDILKSTLRDDHVRYADFKTAEAGEMAMKKHLANTETCKWLGGEFYLASNETIEQAWRVGRDAALQYQKDNTK